MTLRLYFLISLAVFVAVVAGAVYFHIPVLPFAVILLTGETLIGFQIEDHKVARFLSAIIKRPAH